MRFPFFSHHRVDGCRDAQTSDRVRRQRVVGRCIAGLSMGFILGLGGGCSSARVGGSVSPDQALNDLRDENQQLKDQVKQLQQRIDQRVADLQASEKACGLIDQQAQAAMPKLTSLRLGRYSGLVPATEGQPAKLRVYLLTLDQQDRFLPIVGKLNVQAVKLLPDRPPTVLAEMTLDGQAWDAAYRDGLMGTHYTIELALPEQAIRQNDSAPITLSLTLTDLATGRTASLQQVMSPLAR